MSKKTTSGLVVYGASDDLVEVRGVECGELGDGAEIRVGSPDNGGVAILNKHSGKHGWQTTIRLLAVEDDVPVPWPVRVELSETGYSLATFVDCPAGTEVRAFVDGKEVEIA